MKLFICSLNPHTGDSSPELLTSSSPAASASTDEQTLEEQSCRRGPIAGVRASGALRAMSGRSIGGQRIRGAHAEEKSGGSSGYGGGGHGGRRRGSYGSRRRGGSCGDSDRSGGNSGGGGYGSGRGYGGGWCDLGEREPVQRMRQQLRGPLSQGL
uniref:uncharacterized protein n=1 Tax=Pristiophorus japonicus TaxID=55135 RepID=UPI00398F69A4